MLGIDLEGDWAPILDTVAGQRVSQFCLCITEHSLLPLAPATVVPPPPSFPLYASKPTQHDLDATSVHSRTNLIFDNCHKAAFSTAMKHEAVQIAIAIRIEVHQGLDRGGQSEGPVELSLYRETAALGVRQHLHAGAPPGQPVAGPVEWNTRGSVPVFEDCRVRHWIT
ncbi:hypothetical protein K438DRAFT_1765736 [Mycena galopus ATCC 62051]|nr:hypothetical protein K438DRAFT_1765736 [Mycena galopus ATCC 62051]